MKILLSVLLFSSIGLNLYYMNQVSFNEKELELVILKLERRENSLENVLPFIAINNALTLDRFVELASEIQANYWESIDGGYTYIYFEEDVVFRFNEDGHVLSVVRNIE